MKVLVAGDGPVGRALSAAFAAAGLETSAWRRSAGVIDTVEVDDAGADVAVLAISDGAIADVAERLLEEGVAGPESILLHTAGAIAPEVAFAGLLGRVRGTGMLHPLRAFAGAPGDMRLRGTVFGIAGDFHAREMALRLVTAVEGKPLPLTSAALPRYHAAAVLASNHTVALLAAGVRLLAAEGLDEKVAERALSSLMASAADNVATLGVSAALTGPIARGDAAAVERHLAALPPALVPLYRETARATLEIARASGRAEPEALDRIAALLGPR